MIVGVKYPDLGVVSEVFQLLKIPWESYDPSNKYDVVIAYRSEVSDYSGELVDLSADDIFGQIKLFLNGDDSGDMHSPKCDIILDKLRERLIEIGVLVEIPPSPWGYNYILALTHDVDYTSIKECRFFTLGNLLFKCLRMGDFQTMLKILLAKASLGPDPWDLFQKWKQLEGELGVKSTFFFVPKFRYKGHYAPRYRAVNYHLNPELLQSLVSSGWEVGVHGLDNWIDLENSEKELSLFPVKCFGNRTHWLLWSGVSWVWLDKAGYLYDSTLGYNHTIGFRSGTLQVYRPPGFENLLELPLHIQDGALFGSYCWKYDKNKWTSIPCLNYHDSITALSHCKHILRQACSYGGVVTVLWHYESIVPPNNWLDTYLGIVDQANVDVAWITNAIEAVRWFMKRRAATITTEFSGKSLLIHLYQADNSSDSPPLKVRVHLNPSRVVGVNADYILGDSYIDIKCNHRELVVELS